MRKILYQSNKIEWKENVSSIKDRGTPQPRLLENGIRHRTRTQMKRKFEEKGTRDWFGEAK